jgi:hypothetical protein
MRIPISGHRSMGASPPPLGVHTPEPHSATLPVQLSLRMRKREREREMVGCEMKRRDSARASRLIASCKDANDSAFRELYSRAVRSTPAIENYA